MNAELIHQLQRTVDEEASGAATHPLKIVEAGCFDAGKHDYQLEIEHLNAKLGRILKRLEEK
ncbi:hypothetical protein AN401_04035 [Zobellella denitrificans]|jgi:hypothetical protein|uniref:Uncharacterized protein n=1 Tax=Zobellella denitrificans TaxID=347534 RepID=A0A291HLV5_9GAMM|nr:hypothetical protein [Zobellella denitrificans]ATG73123.1 hypothetical protein AN401_04035 [Zobellella denitrificans]